MCRKKMDDESEYRIGIKLMKAKVETRGRVLEKAVSKFWLLTSLRASGSLDNVSCQLLISTFKKAKLRQKNIALA